MGTNDNIEIRPKFQNLIPKLAKHELEKLEASILAEGIREPLTIAVFQETHVHSDTSTARVLVDGHHRHAIAIKHGLTFTTREIEFEDEDAALIWAIDNQLGRRNVIHPLDRVILLEKKRPILERQAQARQLAGKADDGDLALETTQGSKGKKGRARRPTVTEQLAKEAGMGRNSYDACLLILTKGIPALVTFVRDGDLSITAAGKLLNHTPKKRGDMTDEEHRAWQQQLVDNVKGDPDAMQAVVRSINWEERDFRRGCEEFWAEEREKKRKEEEYQAGEKQDEEDIEKWREELEADTTPAEEEQTETAEEEDREEQEASPGQEEETETDTGTEQTATVTEIPRPPRFGENIPEIVGDILAATRGILDGRGLGISVDGERVLYEIVEAWAIKYTHVAYCAEEQAS